MKTKINKSGDKSKGNAPFFPAGNSAGFLNFQAKLSVGEPGDQYETEADLVADKVVNQSPVGENDFFAPSGSSGKSIQEKPLAESVTPFIQMAEKKEEEKPIQKQSDEEEEPIQMRKAPDQSGNQERDSEDLINAGQGNGQSIEGKVKSQMESGFGTRFNGVKIHTDQAAVALSDRLGAQAFTTGPDIYFNSGKYNPETKSGQKLLAHELTHTIQQGASQNSAIQREEAAAVEVEPAVDTCDEATQQEIETFRNHGMYGPQSLSPTTTQTGGFEASYDPLSEALQINVRGRTRFVNGLSVSASGVVSASETDLADLARLLNYIGDPVLSNNIVSTYYIWNEAQRAEATTNFGNRISEAIWIWQDTSFLHFVVDEPCWETVQANVQINIDVQDEGIVPFFTAPAASRDHLQVTLIKNPERSEMQTVRDEIRAVANRLGNERSESIDTSADLTTGASVNSSRITGTANTNPYDSEMVLSNQSLQNTPDEGNNYRSLLRRSVYFENNESTLDATDTGIIDTFTTDFQESDCNLANSVVTLVGHASILGTTSANQGLVNLRLNSVMNYLRSKGFMTIRPSIQTENRSDTDAERFDNTESNAAIFRRVDLIVGTGELQNTVAHEFGHVFGLLDEYASEGTSISGTGTAPGTTVGHSSMAKAIGAGQAQSENIENWHVQSENNDNMMSLGNQVRAQHYGPFGWALSRLTNKNWKVV